MKRLLFCITLLIILVIPGLCFSEELPSEEMVKQWRLMTADNDYWTEFTPKKIEKIYTTSKEEAYLALCTSDLTLTGHALLLTRPSQKGTQVLEEHAVWDFKVLDLDKNGVSEIEMDRSSSKMGYTVGKVVLFNISGWKKQVLHEKSYDSYKGEPKYYLDEPAFGSGGIGYVYFKYEDLNNDGITDLIEEVDIVKVEIEKGVTIEEARNNYKYIHIEDVEAVNKYIFDGKKFIEFSIGEDEVIKSVLGK